MKALTCLALVMVLLLSGCENADRGVIKLDSGPILRRADGFYRGIPYAAPPTGPLRWLPPQPVTPWTAPRRCDTFGPVCLQPDYAGAMSEDCLYLNVWTPARSVGERLPVMVWIHGGAFTFGSGSDELYDGAVLADKGVVVVTFNYRLGVLGFLAHPSLSAESPHQVSGNYGLLDQVAALSWVQRNIAQFGGDPHRVTIFGQSAGASGVSLLLVSPLAQGLFHTAIAESPAVVGCLRPLRHEQVGVVPAETVGVRLAEELGLAPASEMASALRQVPWNRLTIAADALEKSLGVEVLHLVCCPTVDGRVIPDHPVKLFREGRRHPVPLLTGVTANESTIFLPWLMPHFRSPEAYRQHLNATFGKNADRVFQLLPVKSHKDLWPCLDKLITAKWFGAWANYMAATAPNVQQPAWFYRFTRRAPTWATEVLAEDSTKVRLSNDQLGVVHGAEIFSVFGFTKILLGFGFDDWRFSEQIMTYWTNFAKTGQPEGAGIPPWPPYGTLEQRDYVEFGKEIAAKSGLEVGLYDLIAQTWLVSTY
jgi:para-nitrobenzyl esterase